MTKFEVYQGGKKNEYRFRLKADNGQIILSSEGYTNKASCMNGIESVKKDVVDTKRFTKSTTLSSMYRFELLAGNNQTIGVSQNYKSESGRNNGIESMKRSAVKAQVKDLTE